MPKPKNTPNPPLPVMTKLAMVGGLLAGAGAAIALYAIFGGGEPAPARGPTVQGVYDIAPLRETDPSLIGYREVRRIPTGLDALRAIAIGPGDTLYLAGGHAILRLDGDRFAAFAQTADPTRCLAVGPDGTVYAGKLRHVTVFDAEGKPLQTWEALGDESVITSIAVLPRHVAVADSGRREVALYDLDGQFVRRIGRADAERNIPGLIVPSPHLDVATGSGGLLHVTNPGRQRVERYTLRGDLESWWGTPGSAIEAFFGCCNPSDIALLPDGSTITSESGAVPRIKRYGPDGSFQTVVAPASAFDANAFGRQDVAIDLAVDSRQRVIALDPIAGDVIFFERNEP